MSLEEVQRQHGASIADDVLIFVRWWAMTYPPGIWGSFRTVRFIQVSGFPQKVIRSPEDGADLSLYVVPFGSFGVEIVWTKTFDTMRLYRPSANKMYCP